MIKYIVILVLHDVITMDVIESPLHGVNYAIAMIYTVSIPCDPYFIRL